MSLSSNLDSDRLIIAVAVAAGPCVESSSKLADANAAIDVPIGLQSAVSIRTGQPIVK